MTDSSVDVRLSAFWITINNYVNMQGSNNFGDRGKPLFVPRQSSQQNHGDKIRYQRNKRTRWNNIDNLIKCGRCGFPSQDHKAGKCPARKKKIWIQCKAVGHFSRMSRATTDQANIRGGRKDPGWIIWHFYRLLNANKHADRLWFSPEYHIKQRLGKITRGGN